MSNTGENIDVPIELAAEIVAAYVGNNHVPVSELPKLIADVVQALVATAKAEPAPAEPAPLVPAVPVKKSVTDDFIICLEDGKSFKSLKRHLMTHYNLTPDEYRKKWSLPSDYPMVAPNYAAARSALARTMGLGRKPAAPEVAEEPVAAEAPPAAEEKAPAPKRRTRKAKEQAAAE